MNFVFEQYFMEVLCSYLSKLIEINIKQWKNMNNTLTFQFWDLQVTNIKLFTVPFTSRSD